MFTFHKQSFAKIFHNLKIYIEEKMKIEQNICTMILDFKTEIKQLRNYHIIYYIYLKKFDLDISLSPNFWYVKSVVRTSC